MITTIIGISGTRDTYVNGRLVAGYPVSHVYGFVRSLPLRATLLVTGGAIGVDAAAERDGA